MSDDDEFGLNRHSLYDPRLALPADARSNES